MQIDIGVFQKQKCGDESLFEELVGGRNNSKKDFRHISLLSPSSEEMQRKRLAERKETERERENLSEKEKVTKTMGEKKTIANINCSLFGFVSPCPLIVADEIEDDDGPFKKGQVIVVVVTPAIACEFDVHEGIYDRIVDEVWENAPAGAHTLVEAIVVMPKYGDSAATSLLNNCWKVPHDPKFI